MIERSRCGEPINTRLVREVLNSYIQLGLNEDDPYNECHDLTVYKNVFEKFFLVDTERFYACESLKFISQNSVVEYMKMVEDRLQEENERAEVYLHISTKAPLIRTCEIALIEYHLKYFVTNFNNLLDNSRIADLTRMYLLLSRIPSCLIKLSVMLKNYIEARGQSNIETCVNVKVSNFQLYVFIGFNFLKFFLLNEI